MIEGKAPLPVRAVRGMAVFAVECVALLFFGVALVLGDRTAKEELERTKGRSDRW